jgi:hypothetical protein
MVCAGMREIKMIHSFYDATAASGILCLTLKEAIRAFQVKPE